MRHAIVVVLIAYFRRASLRWTVALTACPIYEAALIMSPPPTKNGALRTSAKRALDKKIFHLANRL